MENHIRTKEIAVRAVIIEDKENDVFTVFLEEDGGPIVSAPTIDEAKEKFAEALKLACSVKNLLVFSEAVKADDEMKREELSKKIFRKGPAISYSEELSTL